MTPANDLPDRRTILLAATAAVALLATPLFSPQAVAAALPDCTIQTLEALADTLIPGQRRFPGDHAIADAVTGPGAVQAGALQVLTDPQLPLAGLLPGIATLLDARATAYALTHLILLPLDRPPFVGLSFTHRTHLVADLFDPDDADSPLWQVLALLICLAFDTAAHLHTRDALTVGHPGLTWFGFPTPTPNGDWRFPQHSYRRPLAALHPATTASGSPA